VTNRPVAGFLKRVVDVLASLLKGVIDKKVPFDHGHGPNLGPPK
jgi:hypothetical protein